MWMLFADGINNRIIFPSTAEEINKYYNDGVGNVNYENFKNHTVQGGIILKDLQMMNGLADASMYHHERMDGKGYPAGLAGEEIPLVARITSVSNKIDNKIHEGLNVDEIVAYLEINSGSKFDPEVVEVATNVLRYSNVFKIH